MNITSNSDYRLRYGLKKRQNDTSAGFAPKKPVQNISFKSDVVSVAQNLMNSNVLTKTVKIGNKVLNDNVSGFERIVNNFRPLKIIYSGEKLQNMLDTVGHSIGEEKFNKILSDANILDANGMLDIANGLTLQQGGIISGFKNTITDLLCIIPDIINDVAKKLNKDVSNIPILGKRKKHTEAETAQKVLRDILNAFIPPKKGVTSYNSEQYNNLADRFKNRTVSNIKTIASNYKSRDERALNRLVTATVSTMFSANDFYNITMLQKDDKKAAEKSAKNRTKQEMSRGIINASLQFTLLGALARGIENSVLANAFVVAGATLISEICARLLAKKPLGFISPQKAADIANKQKTIEINKKSKDNASKTNISNKNVAFGAKNDANIIFSQFASKGGDFASINEMKLYKAPASNTAAKKKGSLKSKIIASIVVANAIYVLLRIKQGDIRLSRDFAKFYENEENQGIIKDYLDGKISKLCFPSSDQSAIYSAMMKRAKKLHDKYDIEKTIRDLLTTRNEKIDLLKLKDKIAELNNSKEAASISDLLDSYTAVIDESIRKNGSTVLEYNKKIPILAGLYNGFKKIIDLFYTIATIPSKAILTNKHDKIFNKIKKENFDEEDIAIALYNNIFKRYHSDRLPYKIVNNVVNFTKNIMSKITKKEYTSQEAKIVKKIKKDTTNYEAGVETGELANISRALASVIASVFFVADHRNEVLIDSEGKDIEAANVEVKERIGQKFANFIINGGLMNIFNSLFIVPLNANLLGAAVVPTLTEFCNETLVRKVTFQPIRRMNSKEDIIEFDRKNNDRDDFAGKLCRTYKTITGKRTIMDKAKVKK